MPRLIRRLQNLTPTADRSRRGVVLVVAAFCLVACLTFVAFSVDLGMISLTKTQMQNAVDSAALAGAMEITNALTTAGTDVTNVFEYAKAQAQLKAEEVAELNDVYVDPGSDVTFGRRFFNTSTNDYDTDWNPASNQVNVIKVTARRDNESASAPDAKVPSLFSKVFGNTGTSLEVEAIAYVEPRDMVVVHDFSRSMNFDSYFNDEQSTFLPQETIEANMQMVWDDLQPLTLGTFAYTPIYLSRSKTNTGATATVTFNGKTVTVSTNTKLKTVKLYFEEGGSQTFSISGETTTTGTYAGTGSNSGKRIDDTDITIRKVGSSSYSWTLTDIEYDSTAFSSTFGSFSYPYASGSWSDYIDFVKEDEGLDNYGYRDKYGGMTFVCYLLRMKPNQSQTKDLWKTRHYPFTAIKEGHELLCDYLTDLGFDDYLGMVSYDSSHRIESTLSSSTNSDFPTIDISSNPLTNNYATINNLMHYKQAAYYSSSTNMAGGLKDAISLLDDHKRSGSRPAIILMTDGNGNTVDGTESTSLPTGWSWDELFDYNGDGVADYSSSNSSAKITLRYVKSAVDKGYTVHAISVGVDSDTDLLEAVAYLGGGYHINVPGGQSASDMEAELEEAFAKIAAAVPPARLVKSE
jgi:Flp pilus assembly protein TadG